MNTIASDRDLRDLRLGSGRVRVTGTSFDAYVARPMNSPRAAIVVLHEVFGVNQDMRETCEELADAGFLAVCPDLFWRQEANVDLSVRSEQDWQKGLSLYKAYDVDAGVRDVVDTVRFAGSLQAPGARVGVMGFCLGGLMTYLTAVRGPVDAAVVFHGGRTEEFLAEAPALQSPLQMHLAGRDEFIDANARRQIVDALSGIDGVEMYVYPECNHAFSRHGGMHFDAAAAQQSRERTLAFFGRHLAQ